MTKTIKGRLIDDRTLTLDEPVHGVAVNVEVVVQTETDGAVVQFDDIDDFLNSIPEGTRTREDIDQQIAEERASWSDEL